MRYALILILMGLTMTAGGITLDLPEIDPGAGIWSDFDTGVKSVVFTATVPIARIDKITLNAGLTLPTDLENLDFGGILTAKLGGRFEIGIGTRDWLRDPGMMLRYSF